MAKYLKISTLFYRKFLPELLQQKIDVIRGESQVFKECFEPTKSIFIHVPKAAGTSIARSIYGQSVGHKKATDYIRVSRKTFKQYFSYGFVRNPWDRTVSAYHFAKQGGTKYVQPIENKVYQSKKFRSFESFVKEWLVDVNFEKEDVVFAPQYLWLYENSRCAVNHIGKLENLDSEIGYLESKIGVSVNIPKLNVSNKSKNFLQYYTPDLVDIVGEIYEKDIKLFNYEYTG